MPIRTSIRIVSLADAHARRAAMTQRLAGTGLEWSFFDANRQLVDPLSYRERDAWIARGRPLVGAELGCYCSHYSVWTEFLASSSDQMMVLEDDAGGDWGLLKRELLSFDFSRSGIDLLRLFVGFPARSRQIGVLGGRRVLKFFSYVESTLAYIITRRGAERLVEHCRQIKRPIDDEMDRSWVHGVDSFALFPCPVIEITDKSQICGRHIPIAGNPYPLGRLRYRFEDKAMRLAHELRQHMHQLRARQESTALSERLPGRIV